MIQFKTVTLKDKEWVDRAVFGEDSPSADYNFGNIYVWDKLYRQLICPFEGRMLTKLRYEGLPSFVFPIGTGPVKNALELLRKFALSKGYPLRIRGITERHRELIEQEYPGRFEYSEDTDCEDYVYLAEKLASYSGRALHSKKNHCNRFEAEHDWEFLQLTRELIPRCLDMLDVWSEENAGRLDSSVVNEHDAIIRAFAAYEKLGLEGGVLMSEGRILGFSVGEMTSSDTFDVHFEKAQIDVNGAYPMVCRELTRMMMEKYPKLRYMNREDDMGLESLRKSKLSYKPEFMVKKYTARWKNE
ncbi:MAG: DUF2156 domain-containing protein [Candidatus Limivicinus sp.]|jgi:hypothetical protein